MTSLLKYGWDLGKKELGKESPSMRQKCFPLHIPLRLDVAILVRRANNQSVVSPSHCSRLLTVMGHGCTPEREEKAF